MSNPIVRIALFYDGSFFQVVSRHYLEDPTRRAPLSFSGIRDFVRARVARETGQEPRQCEVVDTHFFRGRFETEATSESSRLVAERTFEDVLVREGITAHYLPMGSRGTEKGIDVWFALEAYELASQGRFDVIALFAGDGDYVPLARKLRMLGKRVMVLGWDFDDLKPSGEVRQTRTSRALLREVTYPVMVSELLADPQYESETRPLFTKPGLPVRKTSPPSEPIAEPRPVLRPRHHGRVTNLGSSRDTSFHFGFIAPEGGGPNLWFDTAELDEATRRRLRIGTQVTFELGVNHAGRCARRVKLAADLANAA